MVSVKNHTIENKVFNMTYNRLDKRINKDGKMRVLPDMFMKRSEIQI